MNGDFTGEFNSNITFISEIGKPIFIINKEGCHIPDDVTVDEASQGVIDALDEYIKNMNKTLIDDKNELLKALEDLYQYADAIVCYASTMDEHEPNRIVYNAKQIIDKIKGE